MPKPRPITFPSEQYSDERRYIVYGTPEEYRENLDVEECIACTHASYAAALCIRNLMNGERMQLGALSVWRTK